LCSVSGIQESNSSKKTVVSNTGKQLYMELRNHARGIYV
jgi:hypothetical protein